MKRTGLYVIALSIIGLVFAVLFIFLVWASETSGVRRFESNRQALTELITQWQNTKNLSHLSNTYWSKETLVWNETVMTETKSEYDVYPPDNRKISVKSLDEAAEVAGTTAEEIRLWKNLMQKLKVTTISTMARAHPVQEQFIQIDIDNGWMSAFRIVGYIYIPEGHDQPYNSFLTFTSENRVPPNYRKIVHLEGRWFYFEIRNI